jgi:hypothetical protein
MLMKHTLQHQQKISILAADCEPTTYVSFLGQQHDTVETSIRKCHQHFFLFFPLFAC